MWWRKILMNFFLHFMQPMQQTGLGFLQYTKYDNSSSTGGKYLSEKIAHYKK